MIDDLPLLTPDASRRAGTLARCHDRLATRRRKIEARNRPSNPKVMAAEFVVATGLCVVYLISMAGNVLRLIDPQ
jgi:hypothetical protein